MHPFRKFQSDLYRAYFFTYKGHEPVLWISPLNSVLLFYLFTFNEGHWSTANCFHICARKHLSSMQLQDCVLPLIESIPLKFFRALHEKCEISEAVKAMNVYIYICIYIHSLFLVVIVPQYTKYIVYILCDFNSKMAITRWWVKGWRFWGDQWQAVSSELNPEKYVFV